MRHGAVAGLVAEAPADDARVVLVAADHPTEAREKGVPPRRDLGERALVAERRRDRLPPDRHAGRRHQHAGPHALPSHDGCYETGQARLHPETTHP